MPNLILFFIPALAGLAAASQSDGNGAIDKVVTLLEDLESTLKNDEKTEQGIYDKYACWCEETTARKAAVVENAQADLKDLGSQILQNTGTVSVRKAEVKELDGKIKDNEEAQELATEVRKKENADWQAESAETKDALAAMNSAVGVLKKATKPALLQQDATAKLQATLSAAITAVPARALSSMDPAKLSSLRGLASSLSQMHSKVDYAPQSQTIQGILADMYTTMGIDLMSETALEAKRNRAFEDFIATKDKELIEMKETREKKERERVEAAAMLAEATQAFDETSKEQKAAAEFFDATKEACIAKTKEWQERSKLRKIEIEGVEKSLEIVTSEDAKKMFAKAMDKEKKLFFLQLGATKPKAHTSSSVNFDKMYNKLAARAAKSHSLRLAALAAQVRLAKAGHFDKVIKAIDKLIGVLADEQQADTEKRDECKEQYQDIAQESKKLEWKITNNKATIKKLENLIEDLDDEREDTVKEIEKTKEEIKDMKKERKEENEEFVQAKKDDEGAIKLLNMAKDMLADFYKKNKVDVGLLQADPLKDPDVAPDASFSDKGKRKGPAKGILQLMAHIIENLENEISNAVKAEEEAQVAFEKALASAEKLQEDLEAKEVSLKETIADRKKDKKNEEKDQKTNEDDLDDQKKEKDGIKEDCDYMIEKYEERRKYRTAESDALTEAKEFLVNYYDENDGADLLQAAPVQSAPKSSFVHLKSPQLRA